MAKYQNKEGKIIEVVQWKQGHKATHGRDDFFVGKIPINAILEDEMRRRKAEGHRTTRSAKLISVIETESLRGNGTEKNQIRVVKQYWSIEGELLAENDIEKEERR